MQSAEKNAEEFLAARGLSLGDVAGCVPEVLPWETVLFGGSIPEGLANADSDVDLLLLGDTQVAASHVMQHCESELVYKPRLGPLKIQIESVRTSHLEMLARRMEATTAAYDNPAGVTRVHVFADADLRVLHRVRTGVCLQHPQVAEKWRERLHTDYLARYMLVFFIGQHFARREDTIGEGREGRRESTLWGIKGMLTHLSGALLASADETHPYEKWRVRLLQIYRDQLDPEMVDALVGYLTAPRFDDFRAYLNEAVDFSDRVLTFIISRRPEVLSVLMEMRKEIPFTTHPD